MTKPGTIPARVTVYASSELEDRLDFQMRAAELPAWETEFKFHPRRKWRADRGWPHLKLLVEVEGGIWTGGRHVTQKLTARADVQLALAMRLGEGE